MLCVYSFAQSPIATIDRLNGPGPTATDHIASMSSIGLTRGAGLAQAGADGLAAFVSNNFTISGDLTAAVANDDYIAWSITANPAFQIQLEDIDINLRSLPNGPSNWQLFYSLDNFATPGIAIGGAQTIATDVTTSYNFAAIVGSYLTINSGTSGTISFRVYAWGALASNGELRVMSEANWSISPTVAIPGIRMTGTIVPPAFPVSMDSDISLETSLTATQNINYALYAATSGLNFSNAITLGGFTIRDGGSASPDSDTNPTLVESIEFAVTNSENIAALSILKPGPPPLYLPVPVAEVTTVSALTNFTGLNLTAPDDSAAFFYVVATFKSTVTDNQQVQLTVNSAITPATGSSLFTAANAGGAATSIASDDNRIEVSATTFEFVQQPTDGNILEIILTFPKIHAVDANGNQDLDANITGIAVISNPSSSLVPETYNMTNGLAVLNNVTFTDTETAVSLVATSGSFSGTSNPFNINGLLLPIIEQNFDSATEWTYTTTTFGDATTWATQTGHFNEIALTDATPLDNILFDAEIFGENNLEASGDPTRIITFNDVDVSSFSAMRIEFDWQVIGYTNNINNLEYQLRLDGALSGSWQTFFDGAGASDINDGQGRVKITIPDGTSTVGLLVRLGNRLQTGYAGLDNFKITRTFNGLIYTNAGGWKNNQAPTASTAALDALIIDGTYNLSGDIQINDFIVQPSAATVIPVAQSLTVNGNLVSEGTLELNSTSDTYSSLIVNGNSVGNVTYFRYVNQFANSGAVTGQNDLIAAPVTSIDQDFLTLRNNNPDIPSGNINGVPSFLFGPFNNNTNAYINYNAANDNDPVEPGIGYRTASTQAGGSLFTFTGTVETNANPVVITRGTNSVFNLIGNPYPSYITLAGFLAANNSEFDPLTAGVYGYDGNASDGFRIWNQAYLLDNPNAVIAPGQGFLVSSKVGGGTVSFPPSMRVKGTADDFIVGRNASPIARLKLKLQATTKQYFTDFYFTDAASLGLDVGYDAAVFNTVTDFGMYSRLVENNTGIAFAVQSLNYNAIENVRIPLGIHANAGEQINLSIEEDTLPQDVEVYLEDQLTQSFTRLDEGTYSFTSGTPLSGTGRFYLNMNRTQLSTTRNALGSLQIYTLAVPKAIRVEGQLGEKTNVSIIDLQGRIVKTTLLNAESNSHQIDLSELKTGVYVVQLKNNSGTKNQKIILR